MQGWETDRLGEAVLFGGRFARVGRVGVLVAGGDASHVTAGWTAVATATWPSITCRSPWTSLLAQRLAPR